MRRPIITKRIINGLIDATNLVIARGTGETWDDDKRFEDVEAANDWAFKMRAWMEDAPARKKRQARVPRADWWNT